MHILFVNPGLFNSGAPKILAWVANQLSTYPELHVTVLTYYSMPVQQCLASKVQFDCLNLPRKSWIYNNTVGIIVTVRRILEYINKKRPDVVISFGDMFSSLMLGRKRSIFSKVIVCERGDPYCTYTLWEVLRRKVLYKRADGMVFQTKGARQWYHEEKHDYSAVIPNPVIGEKTQRLKASERNNTIAFVGRYEHVVKRQDVMLSAFQQLIKRYPEHRDLKLVFYGTGIPKEVNWLKKIIAALQLNEYVKLAGSVSPIQEYIRAAKLFVMTSDHEGIPNALIEAMQLGIPCISTDCSPGGARLLIDNEKNGLLVPRGDVGAIVSAMHELLTNEDKADLLGENAQGIVDTFSEDKINMMWYDYVISFANKRNREYDAHK